METRVLIQSSRKPNAVNPPPQWCLRWNLIMIGQPVSEICLKVWMYRRTDSHTDGRRLESLPISSPWAFGSGELKIKELEWSQDSPIITLWDLSVAMETRVLIRTSRKPNAVNPPPQWCFWWNLIMIGQPVSEICLKVWTHGLTHGHMDGHRLESLTISSPWAFGSGELKMKELEWSQDSPIITLWELSVAMETRVLIRSSRKPNAVNPPPQWCFWWNLIMIGQQVSEICLKFWTHGLTHGHTDGRRLESHTISSPWAFGSGELKMKELEWSQDSPIITL